MAKMIYCAECGAKDYVEHSLTDVCEDCADAMDALPEYGWGGEEEEEEVE